MRRFRGVVLIGVLAVAVSAVAAGPAVAKGGNRDTAKACQKGGWKKLIPDAGGTFANQGDCVNDGAVGSAPFGVAGYAACTDLNGSFNSDSGPGGSGDWSCEYGGPGGATEPALQQACATDTDNSPHAFFQIADVSFDPPPYTWVATCTLP
jgi:hypothetical protein